MLRCSPTWPRQGPFWQQALYERRQVRHLKTPQIYDYIALFDAYECSINPDLLAQRIAEGQALFEPSELLLVDTRDYYDAPTVKAFDFDMDAVLDRMTIPRSDEVAQQLTSLGVLFPTHGSPDSGAQPDANRREQLEAVERWFHHS